MRSAVALAAVLALGPALTRAEGAKPDAKPAESKPAAPAENKAQTEKALYGVGLAVSKNLEVFDLTPAELDQVIKGIRDAQTGKAKVQFDPAMQQQVNELARARAPKSMEKAAAREKKLGAAYLAKMEKEKGVVKTASGALVIPEKEGTGASPTPADKVKVHYTGKLVDGNVFDSSVQRGQPAEFPLNGVIKCWTEGLQKMKVGGKAKIVCPSDIAYGDQGRPPQIPGSAVLTFDVELLDIVK
jgi:FKBP-type peptidyl-prolyl cis-trans isomerase